MGDQMGGILESCFKFEEQSMHIEIKLSERLNGGQVEVKVL